MTIAPEVRLDSALVRLRPAALSDVPHFVRWYSDPEVLHWLHMSEGPAATEESERARIAAAAEDPSQVLWVIETRRARAIGNLGLQQIDPVHRRAWLGICIGERDAWSQGYGSAAIRLLLRYAFESPGLRRIQLIADADNARGIRCYEKCGFYQEALLRAHRLRYGEPLDMVQMAAMADGRQLEVGG